MPDFSALGLPTLLMLFASAAALVWFAGARISGFAAAISDRTGVEQAVVGVVLLGGATSLPEITTSSVATVAGNPNMAVNNLLGGVGFQMVVLAIADLFVGKGALTSMVPTTRVMVNAVTSIMLLALVLLGTTTGDVALPFVGVGLFPLLIVATYVFSLWVLGSAGSGTGWQPREEVPALIDEGAPSELSNAKLAIVTGLAALGILLGGTVLALSAEAIAGRTGIELEIAGLTFLAVATSLPELSTAIAAVRLRKVELAIGDILGGNMFCTALVLLVDVLHPGGPVLGAAAPSSTIMALTGIILTGFLLLGLLERRNEAALRMGYDTIAILVCYIAATVAIIVT